MKEHVEYQSLYRRAGCLRAEAGRVTLPAFGVSHQPENHQPRRRRRSEDAWMVGEHRSSGERKYDLPNFSADTPIKDVAGATKARWICEQAHQQLKDARSQSFRTSFINRIASPYAHDNDRLYPPPDTKARSNEAEKDAPIRHLNRAIRLSVRPFFAAMLPVHPYLCLGFRDGMLNPEACRRLHGL